MAQAPKPVGSDVKIRIAKFACLHMSFIPQEESPRQSRSSAGTGRIYWMKGCAAKVRKVSLSDECRVQGKRIPHRGLVRINCCGPAESTGVVISSVFMSLKVTLADLPAEGGFRCGLKAACRGW